MFKERKFKACLENNEIPDQEGVHSPRKVKTARKLETTSETIRKGKFVSSVAILSAKILVSK